MFDLADLTGVKPEIIEAMEADGLTIESIARGSHNLTTYYGVGQKTAADIMDQAWTLLWVSPLSDGIDSPLSLFAGIDEAVIEAMTDDALTVESIATGGHDLTVYEGVDEKDAESFVLLARALLLQAAAAVAVAVTEDESSVEAALPPMSARVRRIAESVGKNG